MNKEAVCQLCAKNNKTTKTYDKLTKINPETRRISNEIPQILELKKFLILEFLGS